MLLEANTKVAELSKPTILGWVRQGRIWGFLGVAASSVQNLAALTQNSPYWMNWTRIVTNLTVSLYHQVGETEGHRLFWVSWGQEDRTGPEQEKRAFLKKKERKLDIFHCIFF